MKGNRLLSVLRRELMGLKDYNSCVYNNVLGGAQMMEEFKNIEHFLLFFLGWQPINQSIKSRLNKQH